MRAAVTPCLGDVETPFPDPRSGHLMAPLTPDGTGTRKVRRVEENSIGPSSQAPSSGSRFRRLPRADRAVRLRTRAAVEDIART